jgi:hypothetical protein
MAREPRRVITGHDAEGKSVFIIDAPPPPRRIGVEEK